MQSPRPVFFHRFSSYHCFHSLLFFPHQIMAVTANSNLFPQTISVNVLWLNLRFFFLFEFSFKGGRSPLDLFQVVRGTCLARARSLPWASAPLVVAIINLAGRICVFEAIDTLSTQNRPELLVRQKWAYTHYIIDLAESSIFIVNNKRT